MDNGIIWLSSYPKSGNTWLRYLLYAYFIELPNDMINLNRYWPDIHQLLKGHKDVENAREVLLKCTKISNGSKDQYFVVKTHFTYTATHPLIEDTHKVIVVVRDPRSVLLSAVNYKHLRGQLKEKDYISYAETFISHGGDKQWDSQGYGTWSGHLESWMKFNLSDKLFIGYADLKANPIKVFSDVLQFLGIEPDETRVRDAVESTQLDRLRQFEIKSQQVDSENKKLFFNKGNMDVSLDRELSLGLDDKFDDAFASKLELVDRLCVNI